MMTHTERHRSPRTQRALRTVAVVSRRPHKQVLDAVGTYDVVLIESLDQAYSHIKRLAPQLVIICLESDNLEGAQVLSMLNLDKATSGIPVITYLAPGDAEPSPPSTLGRAPRVD